METDIKNEDRELAIGDTVAYRTVIAETKRYDRVVGDRYASWVAICHNGNEYHKYAVWTVVARPEGWHAEQGDYCHTFTEAVKKYMERGGE
jgi:hypothetical protein